MQLGQRGVGGSWADQTLRTGVSGSLTGKNTEKLTEGK